MSYPSPYQPPGAPYPTFDYGQQPDVLAPARRAAVLMYVLGGLVLVSSLCCAGLGVAIPRTFAERPEAFAELSAHFPQITPEAMQAAVFVFAAVMFLGAMAFIVLGRFVGQGSKGAIIAAIVLSVLAMLLLLLNLISALLQIGAMGPRAVPGLCAVILPLALFALLVVWLFGAMRSADQVSGARYAAQYWQYAQQQQHPGYGAGYGYPPPPPAGQQQPYQGPRQPPPPPPQ